MVLAFRTLKHRNAITHYAVPNTSNYYTTFTTVRLLLFVLPKPLTGSGNAGECIIDVTFRGGRRDNRFLSKGAKVEQYGVKNVFFCIKHLFLKNISAGFVALLDSK